MAVALAALLLIAVAASFVGGLRRERQIATAAVRATVQLAAVALIITAVLGHLVWSLLFCVVHADRGHGDVGAADRGAPRAWAWVCLAISAGVLPTLSVIFASGAVPFTGVSLVPVAGIVIGGAMTASSLTGRRVFAALRDEWGTLRSRTVDRTDQG